MVAALACGFFTSAEWLRALKNSLIVAPAAPCWRLCWTLPPPSASRAGAGAFAARRSS